MTAQAIQRIDAPPPIPPRPADGHKGTFGRVLVVGGSAAMLGAPVLAGTAALRMGSGLVQLALAKASVPFALSITPELVSLPLPDDEDVADEDHAKLVEAAEKADALVIGPGLGTSPAARGRVLRLLTVDRPAVIDADALNLIAAEGKWPAGTKLRAVLTPHPGEMARLGKLIDRTTVPTDDAGRLDLAASAARAFGQVVLLKGHRTVVTDGRRAYVNATGDSTLAKAGAGDVLSGMIGSLIGQGMEPFEAACAAAHLHGKAGEAAGRKLGRRSALARDVIDAIGEAVGMTNDE